MGYEFESLGNGDIVTSVYYHFLVRCTWTLIIISLIIIFALAFVFMRAWVGPFLMKDFQTFLSLARSLLNFLSFRSFLVTSFHAFLGRPLGNYY